MKKGRIAKSEIINACLNGVISSHKQYFDMSGYWLWSAPEYFITTIIAQNLFGIDGKKYVTLENNALDGLYDSNALGKGKLHRDIRSNGRFDLLFWWGYDQPRAVIEVKNRVTNKTQYEADIKRIKGVLNRKSEESTIEFGSFVFYTETLDTKGNDKSSLKKIDIRIETIESNVADILGDQFQFETIKEPFYCPDEKAAWAAVCIVIKRCS